MLSQVDVEGESLFARTVDLDALSGTSPSRRVRLLPAFDHYVLGAGTADPQVVPPARRSLVSKAAGWNLPVVVVGGRVAGTWEVNRDELTIGLFDEADRVQQRAIDEEIAFLEKVLDRRLTASITTV